MRLITFASVALICSLSYACGDDTTASGGAGTGGSNTNAGAGSSSGGESAAGGQSANGGQSATGGGTGTGGGSMQQAFDPNLDGPYSVTEITDSTMVAATGDSVPIHGWYPSGGPEAGPYPLVVVAHGFQLPPSQYDQYAHRLATFGYVAVTADFPSSFFGFSHLDVAKNLVGAIDWAAAEASLQGVVDANTVGMTGHSLGGKTSLLAATLDPRVKAVIALDPVDSSMNCSPQDCPDVSSLMSTLNIPTGFLGETTDASGGFQPCAPAADNFTTFYAGANSPSFQVTVNGANHMSFLDDVASCGFTCNFCNAATADNATVNAMARAYVAAFFERHLRGNAAYETYLTGAEAQSRYVANGLATITSK